MIKKKKLALILAVVFIAFVIAIPLINPRADENGTPLIEIALKDGYPTPNPAEIDEEVEVVYTVSPGEIKLSDIKEDTVRDIVFAIDTSESMYKCIDHDLYINHKSGVANYNQCTYGCTQKDRRIELVKEALKDFMDTLRNVENLNIGLVTYSYYGEILLSNNKANYFNISTEYDEILKKIDSLVAEGATNTGDGLRRGAYLLKEGKAENKDKTLIFFTDGEPSRYLGGSEKEYIMDISNDRANNTNSISDKDKALDYAIKIGNIISKENYNIISIACALKDSSNEKIKSIHQAMGGRDKDIYLANNKDALAEIFKGVAEEIKESYTINNVSLNIPKSESFMILDQGTNIVSESDSKYKINIGNIYYKLNAEGTAYVAAPFEVSFKIKPKKEGTFIFGENSLLTYTDVKGNNIEKKLNGIEIEVVGSNTPNIKAELNSESKNPTVFTGNEVIVNYTISGDSFDYKGLLDYGEKEIAILIDTSSSMENLWSQVGNGIRNELLNGLINSGGGKVTYKIITYNEDVNLGDEIKTTDRDQNGAIIDYRNKLQDRLQSIQISNSSSRRNLGKALKAAVKYFDENGNPDSGKNIVIIGSGDSTDSVDDISEFIKANYNVITLDANRDGNLTSYSDLSLKSCHNKLSSEEENYFERTDKDSSYNSIANTVAKEMAKRIKSVFFAGNFIINDAVLNFDLGEDLIPVEGLENITGTQYSYKLPEIVFKPQLNSNGLYTYTMDSFKITFKIKVKEVFKNLVVFGNEGNKEYNNISYSRINNKMAKGKIDTPRINIISSVKNLKHGLYEGINNNQVLIDTAKNREFAAETNINFAASFTALGNCNVLLTTDKNGVINGQPKIYKLDNNQLIEIGSLEALENNNEYSFDLSGIENETKLVVLYEYRINNDKQINTITNNITVSTSTEDATVKLKKDNNGDIDSLPDLF